MSITEDIKQALGNNQIVCGIFIDLQKAFDTVNHEILLNKLHHYGIRVANDWIRFYLTNHKQFVSVNGTNSDKIMKHGVPQGSVLGPLLFLVYINDLRVCIKYSKLNLFADDSSLLLKNASRKQLQKYINLDLKNLCNWLKANKISLNAGKTELVIFQHPNKKINYEFKIKMNGKKIYESNYVIYLGILIDSHLNWSYHLNSVSTKLAHANGMLSKIRQHYPQSAMQFLLPYLNMALRFGVNTQIDF